MSEAHYIHNIAELNFHQATDQIKEKLYARQSERLKLEQQLNKLLTSRKNTNAMKIKELHRNWQRFVEQDKISQARNERILQELNRIEVQADILASRSENLRIIKERYEAKLARCQSIIIHDKRELTLPTSIAMKPVYHSTPKKPINDCVDDNRSGEPIPDSSPNTKNDPILETNIIPKPPPRTKKKLNLSQETDDFDPTIISLRSSSIIKKNITKDSNPGINTGPQPPNTYNQKKSPDKSQSTYEKSITTLSDDALNSSSLTSLSLPDKVQNLQLNELTSGKEDISSTDILSTINSSSMDDVLHDKIKPNSDSNNHPVSTHSSLSECSSSSSEVNHDTTSDLTCSEDDEIMFMDKRKLKQSENEEMKNSVMYSKSSIQVSPKTKQKEEITSGSESDDFFDQKVPLQGEKKVIMKSPPTPKKVVPVEVDDDIENELMAALSGHSVRSERLNSNSSSDDGPLKSSGRIARETVKKKKSKQDKKRPPKDIQSSQDVKKWRLDVDSDSDISFGNAMLIPGIESDKDDFDFVDSENIIIRNKT